MERETHLRIEFGSQTTIVGEAIWNYHKTGYISIHEVPS